MCSFALLFAIFSAEGRSHWHFGNIQNAKYPDGVPRAVKKLSELSRKLLSLKEMLCFFMFSKQLWGQCGQSFLGGNSALSNLNMRLQVALNVFLKKYPRFAQFVTSQINEYWRR